MFSNIYNISYLKNEPLSNHCTFKVGGNAKHFIFAHSIESLLEVLEKCKQYSINHKIIGGGSNILFDDMGFDGAIIVYDNNLKQIDDNLLYANSGCITSELISYCMQHNLGGIEFCAGVATRLGGAIVNNFGAYDSQISDFVEQVTILRNNHLVYLNTADCKFGYHSSIFQNSSDIILAAILKLPKQDKVTTQTNIINFINKRKTSQPIEHPSAGSIFKRTENVIPAKLIDDCGLKGFSVNNAEISTKHAGFIINKGQASSKDILTLIKIIKQKIYEKYDTLLELEVEYLPCK